ncbi:myosin heavy chain, striated muscle-like isoform X2 [Haliotis rufescens]|uniref:myosin heavy chain, striated muscle-like isoform X2 n=1 Tax=Haliotis rufescens TaxID=6454 RepID=UPI00201F929D|nr:myosin heavy chain, striated muscle-like isoform X2 [Haliotis rufescens]
MSSQTEVPGVNNAVEKLQELGDRMRSEQFGFLNSDVSNIDKVIEALHELEQERKQLHDELETETIKASVNRHKLQFLPAEIKEEIMVAVNSARQSNAKAQQELQDKLDNINTNIVYQGERQRELEKENSILHPERELVRQQHEEIISQLNQRMAEKASMQIALNETRDKVRQANQNIVDLEDGILQLKEDLIQERTEARHEKKRLKRAVADTTEKTRDQREHNMGKKKELDVYHELLFDSEGKLDALRKSIRRFETTKSRLEEEENNLSTRLSKQMKTNKALQAKGEKIVKDSEEEQKGFAEDEKKLASKIEQFDGEVGEEAERLKELEMEKMDLQANLREKQAKGKADAARVGELDILLQTAKQNLALKAEEVGRMQAENIDMTEEMETLGESHKAVVAQLSKQLEEFREMLNNEKKDRLNMQGQKDNVQKDLEDFKTEQQRFMQSVNQKIQEGKTKHVALANEGAQIQKDIRKDEEEIHKMQAELGTLEAKYKDMFSAMHAKKTTMEEEIVSMETDQVNKSKEVSEKMPVFQQLEVTFEERSEGYDKMKKDVVAFKNKKMSLEDAIVKSKRDKEDMGAPQMKLREDLKQLRAEFLTQMKTHCQLMQGTEEQIYREGSKLKKVMEENHRFQESCKKLEADIVDIQSQMEINEEATVRLQKELVQSKEALVNSWEADKTMQELFADRDKDTVEAFGRLLEKTENRETTISDVTGRLTDELSVLANFLDNVSSRRPRETRSGQRPSKSSARRPATGSTHRARSAVEAVAAANHASPGTPHPPSLDLRASRQSNTEKSLTSRPTTSGSRPASKSMTDIRTPRSTRAVATPKSSKS